MKSATNRRRRPLVQLLGRAELLDPAAVHDRDPVAHRQRLLLVVGHVHERDPDLGLDALELDLELAAKLEVERTERLVEEQDVGPVHERPGEGDALLLAARQLGWACASRSPSAGRARAPRRRAGRSRLRSTFLRRKPEPDVARDVEVREQRVLLEDHVDRPLVGRVVRDVAAAKQDPAGRSAARSRRSSEASWSCRSPMARAARRTRRGGSRARRRRPPGPRRTASQGR